MAIWKWLTGRLNVTSDLDKWRMMWGFDHDSGQNVTPDSAMKLSTWWAAKRLISETISTLPAGVFATASNDQRTARKDHRLYEILQITPNADQTAVEFWEGRIAPLCDFGNSYAEKKFIGDRLVALQPMKAENTTPLRDSSDRLFYRFNDRGKNEDLPKDKVFHIKGFAPNDEDEGLSPVAYAARSLGAAISADRASARLFSKGLRNSGFWKPPVTMDKDQRQQFMDNYVKPFEGHEGQGSGIIMPPGFDWQSLNITPRDAELIMARGFSVEDVCRWMGVPPILVGHASEGQTMWGSGVEQIILGWLILGLRAYLKRIESAVNTRLVTPTDRAAGIYFEFNFEGLLRADSAGRAALMSSLAQNGLRTRDELRKLDNLAPKPGGDVLTVQSALVPLDQIGKQQSDANSVRNALRAWLIEEREERKAA
ncbi:phage portal protein [Mesorhizobium sp. M7A.F.Ca.CA.004.09.1.2]|uniref:phage portal protein n=1 Tax=Mesorhizobium sp. M7A.F.Ca.CA.004.09.1.2 TaxID=2496695 RepID=UPI000FCBF1FA|nr:phage portal protein [Mesorhizobium sp. M7A.F.Ca.CA.004.09.1.2]RVA59179.1 phage portal protein [Mesorhizobium sp. M7A.F.Ca.CA.004.09.1.2]